MRSCLLLIIYIFVVIATLGSNSVWSQNKEVGGDVCECQFAKYKAMEFSHALLNAAVTKVRPKYSATAKAVKATGSVEVAIIVDRRGNVVDSCVLSGHPLLRKASKDAALLWKFKRNFGLYIRQRSPFVRATITMSF